MTVELAFEKKLVQLRLCNGQLFVCFTQFLILRRPMLGPKRPIFIQKRPKGPVTTQKRPILTQDRRKKSIFSPKDLCAHFRNSYLECAHSRACRLCWQKISQKSQFTALNDCRTYFWEIYSSIVGMHLSKGLSSVLTRISQKSQFTVLNDCKPYFWEIYSSYAPIQGNCVCASWADRNDTAWTRLDAQTWCSCCAGIYIFKFVYISVYICT